MQPPGTAALGTTGRSSRVHLLSDRVVAQDVDSIVSQLAPGPQEASGEKKVERPWPSAAVWDLSGGIGLSSKVQEAFHSQVLSYGLLFPGPPPLRLAAAFVAGVLFWLDVDEENIALLYLPADSRRTAAALLVVVLQAVLQKEVLLRSEGKPDNVALSSQEMVSGLSETISGLEQQQCNLRLPSSHRRYLDLLLSLVSSSPGGDSPPPLSPTPLVLTALEVDKIPMDVSDISVEVYQLHVLPTSDGLVEDMKRPKARRHSLITQGQKFLLKTARGSSAYFQSSRKAPRVPIQYSKHHAFSAFGWGAGAWAPPSACYEFRLAADRYDYQRGDALRSYKESPKSKDSMSSTDPHGPFRVDFTGGSSVVVSGDFVIVLRMRARENLESLSACHDTTHPNPSLDSRACERTTTGKLFKPPWKRLGTWGQDKRKSLIKSHSDGHPNQKETVLFYAGHTGVLSSGTVRIRRMDLDGLYEDSLDGYPDFTVSLCTAEYDTGLMTPWSPHIDTGVPGNSPSEAGTSTTGSPHSPSSSPLLAPTREAPAATANPSIRDSRSGIGVLSLPLPLPYQSSPASGSRGKKSRGLSSWAAKFFGLKSSTTQDISSRKDNRVLTAHPWLSPSSCYGSLRLAVPGDVKRWTKEAVGMPRADRREFAQRHIVKPSPAAVDQLRQAGYSQDDVRVALKVVRNDHWLSMQFLIHLLVSTDFTDPFKEENVFETSKTEWKKDRDSPHNSSAASTLVLFGSERCSESEFSDADRSVYSSSDEVSDTHTPLPRSIPEDPKGSLRKTSAEDVYSKKLSHTSDQGRLSVLDYQLTRNATRENMRSLLTVPLPIRHSFASGDVQDLSAATQPGESPRSLTPLLQRHVLEESMPHVKLHVPKGLPYSDTSAEATESGDCHSTVVTLSSAANVSLSSLPNDSEMRDVTDRTPAVSYHKRVSPRNRRVRPALSVSMATSLEIVDQSEALPEKKEPLTTTGRKPLRQGLSASQQEAAASLAALFAKSRPAVPGPPGPSGPLGKVAASKKGIPRGPPPTRPPSHAAAKPLVQTPPPVKPGRPPGPPPKKLPANGKSIPVPILELGALMKRPPTKVPKKREVVPLGRKMFWKPIAEARLEGTIFAELYLENEIDVPITDRSHLEQVFSKPEKPKEAPKEEDNRKQELTTRGSPKVARQSQFPLLDPKRAQNLSIVLARLPKNSNDYGENLRSLKYTEFTVEELQKLDQVIIPEVEDKLFEDYLQTHYVHELRTTPEQWLDPLRPSNLPQAKELIRLMQLQLTISNDCAILQRHLDIAQAASEEVRTSAKFRQVLSVVLRWGNYVNHGVESAREMRIRGFTLSSLLKLTDFKSQVDARITSLHYLTMMMLSTAPELRLERLAFEMPSVSEAARLSQEMFDLEMRSLKDSARFLQSAQTMILEPLLANSSTSVDIRNRAERLTRFIESTVISAKEMENRYQEVLEDVRLCATFFGDDTASTKERFKCEEFFTTLKEFLKRFDDAIADIVNRPQAYEELLPAKATREVISMLEAEMKYRKNNSIRPNRNWRGTTQDQQDGQSVELTHEVGQQFAGVSRNPSSTKLEADSTTANAVAENLLETRTDTPPSGGSEVEASLEKELPGTSAVDANTQNLDTDLPMECVLVKKAGSSMETRRSTAANSEEAMMDYISEKKREASLPDSQDQAREKYLDLVEQSSRSARIEDLSPAETSNNGEWKSASLAVSKSLDSKKHRSCDNLSRMNIDKEKQLQSTKSDPNFRAGKLRAALMHARSSTSPDNKSADRSPIGYNQEPTSGEDCKQGSISAGVNSDDESHAVVEADLSNLYSLPTLQGKHALRGIPSNNHSGSNSPQGSAVEEGYEHMPTKVNIPVVAYDEAADKRRARQLHQRRRPRLPARAPELYDEEANRELDHNKPKP